jgi:ABC-type transport system involved in multi-copper enzyme maturation permease subunit
VIGRLSAIAANTFREAVRSRVFASLFVFAGAALAFSLVLGAMSVHNEVRVTTDVSLFASTIFSMIIAVYTSITLLRDDIDRHTVHTILTKPVRRWEFIVGKFLGICALMAAIVAVLFVLSVGLRTIQGDAFTASFAYAFLLIVAQLVVLVAFTIFFASFSSPLLSGLLAAVLFLVGHLHDKLSLIEEYLEFAWVGPAVAGLEVVIPDLAALNLAEAVLRDIPVPVSYLLHAAWYVGSYAALAVAGAALIFSRRDLV